MPCVDNKNLIYNTKELPETFSVSGGDLLLIETDEGTNILDYANFIIGLDNTTFGTTIVQHSTDIISLSSNVNALSSEIESLSSQVDTDIANLSATVVGNTTKALVTLSADDEFSAALIAGTNIASVEYIPATDIVQFNFTTNLANTNYLVLPSTVLDTTDNKTIQLVEHSKNTNYVELKAIDISDGTVVTTTNNNVIGFEIRTF
ncbi:hypothetical protein N9Z65_00315 [bacterium]|nr:hypothetical protein [bacterium]